jgi:hypothetical protein
MSGRGWQAAGRGSGAQRPLVRSSPSAATASMLLGLSWRRPDGDKNATQQRMAKKRVDTDTPCSVPAKRMVGVNAQPTSAHGDSSAKDGLSMPRSSRWSMLASSARTSQKKAKHSVAVTDSSCVDEESIVRSTAEDSQQACVEGGVQILQLAAKDGTAHDVIREEGATLGHVNTPCAAKPTVPSCDNTLRWVQKYAPKQVAAVCLADAGKMALVTWLITRLNRTPSVPNGMLLLGAQGCGKRALVVALCTELNVELVEPPFECIEDIVDFCQSQTADTRRELRSRITTTRFVNGVAECTGGACAVEVDGYGERTVEDTLGRPMDMRPKVFLFCGIDETTNFRDRRRDKQNNATEAILDGQQKQRVSAYGGKNDEDARAELGDGMADGLHGEDKLAPSATRSKAFGVQRSATTPQAKGKKAALSTSDDSVAAPTSAYRPSGGAAREAAAMQALINMWQDPAFRNHAPIIVTARAMQGDAMNVLRVALKDHHHYNDTRAAVSHAVQAGAYGNSNGSMSYTGGVTASAGIGGRQGTCVPSALLSPPQTPTRGILTNTGFQSPSAPCATRVEGRSPQTSPNEDVILMESSPWTPGQSALSAHGNATAMSRTISVDGIGAGQGKGGNAASTNRPMYAAIASSLAQSSNRTGGVGGGYAVGVGNYIGSAGRGGSHISRGKWGRGGGKWSSQPSHGRGPAAMPGTGPSFLIPPSGAHGVGGYVTLPIKLPLMKVKVWPPARDLVRQRLGAIARAEGAPTELLTRLLVNYDDDLRHAINMLQDDTVMALALRRYEMLLKQPRVEAGVGARRPRQRQRDICVVRFPTANVCLPMPWETEPSEPIDTGDGRRVPPTYRTASGVQYSMWRGTNMLSHPSDVAWRSADGRRQEWWLDGIQTRVLVDGRPACMWCGATPSVLLRLTEQVSWETASGAASLSRSGALTSARSFFKQHATPQRVQRTEWIWQPIHSDGHAQAATVGTSLNIGDTKAAETSTAVCDDEGNDGVVPWRRLCERCQGGVITTDMPTNVTMAAGILAPLTLSQLHATVKVNLASATPGIGRNTDIWSVMWLGKPADGDGRYVDIGSCIRGASPVPVHMDMYLALGVPTGYSAGNLKPDNLLPLFMSPRPTVVTADDLQRRDDEADVNNSLPLEACEFLYAQRHCHSVYSPYTSALRVGQSLADLLEVYGTMSVVEQHQEAREANGGDAADGGLLSRHRVALSAEAEAALRSIDARARASAEAQSRQQLGLSRYGGDAGAVRANGKNFQCLTPFEAAKWVLHTTPADTAWKTLDTVVDVFDQFSMTELIVQQNAARGLRASTVDQLNAVAGVCDAWSMRDVSKYSAEMHMACLGLVRHYRALCPSDGSAPGDMDLQVTAGPNRGRNSLLHASFRRLGPTYALRGALEITEYAEALKVMSRSGALPSAASSETSSMLKHVQLLSAPATHHGAYAKPSTVTGGAGAGMSYVNAASTRGIMSASNDDCEWTDTWPESDEERDVDDGHIPAALSTLQRETMLRGSKRRRVDADCLLPSPAASAREKAVDIPDNVLDEWLLDVQSHKLYARIVGK